MLIASNPCRRWNIKGEMMIFQASQCDYNCFTLILNWTLTIEIFNVITGYIFFNPEQNYNVQNRLALSQPIRKCLWYQVFPRVLFLAHLSDEQAGLRFIKPRLASFTAILATSKHIILNTLHCADYQYFQYFDFITEWKSKKTWLEHTRADMKCSLDPQNR